jgi:hypothetical protein
VTFVKWFHDYGSYNWELFTYDTHYSLKHALVDDAKDTQYSLNPPDQFELPGLHQPFETGRAGRRHPMMETRYSSGPGVRFAPARWDWEKRDATYNITILPEHFLTSRHINYIVRSSCPVCISPVRLREQGRDI